MSAVKKQFKYYWEDFPVGTVREFGQFTFSKDEIIRFARQYDPQPFHVDEEAAKHTVFGGLIASGWQTCGAAMRMMCDEYLLDSASAGSPGVEFIRWTAPVRPGDTLRMKLTVLESRVLNSKPHIGLLRNKWELFNQNGEQVMHMEGYGMFLRRDHSG
jgi:acyl dehydratase